MNPNCDNLYCDTPKSKSARVRFKIGDDREDGVCFFIKLCYSCWTEYIKGKREGILSNTRM